MHLVKQRILFIYVQLLVDEVKNSLFSKVDLYPKKDLKQILDKLRAQKNIQIVVKGNKPLEKNIEERFIYVILLVKFCRTMRVEEEDMEQKPGKIKEGKRHYIERIHNFKRYFQLLN